MIERCQYQFSFSGSLTFFTMPRKSIFDDHFETNASGKHVTCLTCQKILSRNTDGMRKHMRVMHSITVPKKRAPVSMEENVNEIPPVVENEIESPRKKSKIEPIEDQVCRETAQFGASFR